eukprot:633803-Pelagomonas_calceolata.AAC.1
MSANFSPLHLLHSHSNTADGTSDTSPGFVDENGNLVDEGKFWRHKRLCLDDQNCLDKRIIYK